MTVAVCTFSYIQNSGCAPISDNVQERDPCDGVEAY